MSEEHSTGTNAHAKTRRLGRGLASLMANTREIPDPRDTPAVAGDANGATDSRAEAVVEVPALPAGTETRPRVGAWADHTTPAPAGVYAPVNPTPAATPPADEIVAPMEIDITAIRPNPYQPRRSFDETELAELAESIRVQGVLQPLLLARANGGYVLIAGERRLRAAALAGLQTVPCVIRQAPREKMAEWAITENVQRSDLNPLEKAHAYRQYMDTFMVTQQQLAAKLGQPRSSIANILRLLDLCDDAQRAVAEGRLSFGHAKLLATLAGRERDQQRLLRGILDKDVSVRQLEEQVNALAAAAPDAAAPDAAAPSNPLDAPARPAKSDYVLDVERQLTRAVGARVVIKPSRRSGRGRIILNYNSLDEFDRIAEALGARLES